jgi:(E)-4-hydroxy-3-methylbut-2-enyl-diphosphate synthase
MSEIARRPVKRRTSRPIALGDVPIGGGAPITVQSAITTPAADVDAVLKQMAEAVDAGCQVARLPVSSGTDVEAVARIVAKSPLPVVADVRGLPRYAFAAIDAGCAGIRFNPDGIRSFDDRVAEIARTASAAGTPIQIGIEADSLDMRYRDEDGEATVEALVDAALWECSLLEEFGVHDIVVEIQHSRADVAIGAYRQVAEESDYPLHISVTEVGPAFWGSIRNAVPFGALIAEGIGDTIQVSLPGSPASETRIGMQILESLGLRDSSPTTTACPSCGR